jgi:hypothetical protein
LRLQQKIDRIKNPIITKPQARKDPYTPVEVPFYGEHHRRQLEAYLQTPYVRYLEELVGPEHKNAVLIRHGEIQQESLKAVIRKIEPPQKGKRLGYRYELFDVRGDYPGLPADLEHGESHLAKQSQLYRREK